MSSVDAVDEGPAARGTSLRNLVFNAGFWSFSLRSTTRGFAFVRNVVLARILAPDDFGLFGIALVVLAIVQRFSNTGLHGALVQKRADIHEYLDTAWTIQALRGLALAVGLAVAAPYIAEFFGEPRAANLIRVLGLSMLLRSLQNSAVVYFERELEIKKSFTIVAVADSADLIVSITAAVLLRNSWALMLGLIASNLISLWLSYFLHPYRPRPYISWSQARELSRYGRWIFLNTMLNFLMYRGDNLLIGKVLGPAALGVYMLAYSISDVVTVEISRVLGKVAFPAYSRSQGDLKRVRRGFFVAVELVSSLSFPIAVGVWLLAEPLISAILGERWAAAAGVLPFLAAAGSIRAMLSNNSAVLQGLGRPAQAFQLNVIGVTVMYGVMFPLITRYGLVGVGVAVLAGLLAKVPLSIYRVLDAMQGRIDQFARALLPAAVLAISVGLSITLSQQMLPAKSIGGLAVALAAALAAYLLSAGVLWKSASIGPVSLLIMVRDTRRNTGAKSRSAVATPVRER